MSNRPAVLLLSILAAASVPLAAPAGTPDFAQRVQAAKKLERTKDGLAYLMAYMTAMDAGTSKALGDCFRGTESGTRVGFAMVADIQRDGTLANVDVSPRDSGTECYAERVGALRAPPLPATFRGESFPIVVEVDASYH